MKLLITGYPGWLSNRFLNTLHLYPHGFRSVRCLSQQEAPLPFPDCEIVKGDILDPGSLEKAVRGCEAVLHTAGILHVRRIRDFYAINRDGTKNLLEASVKAGVKRFVFISTNAAQGFCANAEEMLDEASPCHPEGDYGRSKFGGEQAVQSFYREGQIETVILRSSMFYGPPVPPRHVDIFRKIQKGFFPVFGTGEYRRAITYIDNLIQAIHLGFQKPKTSGEVYTIIDPVIPTLNQIIDAMGEALGVPVKRIHLPASLAFIARKVDDVIAACDRYWMLPHIVGESCRHIAYSITKARNELGYTPAVTYREGYPLAIRWCKEQGLLK